MRKGSHHTPETQAKMREAWRHRVGHSEETKAKMRATWARPEVKAKLIESRRKQMGTPEARARVSKQFKGKNNPNWVGGRVTHSSGYILVLMPGHPAANCAGYVLEHRLVMEKMLGRFLEPHERVHHKNKTKTDNRPENLELVVNTNHYGRICCPFCRKDFLIQ